MHNMAWGIGLQPEQVWENPDIPQAPYGSNPATASIGFTDGQAAGSATPLIWAEGQYVRLVRDRETGRLSDQPSITRDRYVTAGPPDRLPITITAPANGAVAGSTTVIGTTAPGAQVTVSSDQPGSSADSAAVVATAAPSGQFEVTVPTPAGSDTITVAATKGSHSSGWAQETVGSS
jgi:glucoamylase